MARYELPDVGALQTLGEQRENAITIYARTSPTVDEREGSYLTAKSAFDQAIRTLREDGLRHTTETALRDQWEKVRTDEEAWGKLSRSLAIFLSPDLLEVYVVPNELENQLQVGHYFDIGQLVRVVVARQSAFALTLSANGWNLWEATATTEAAELELSGELPADAADATNRATIRDRDHVRRLVGDEGKKVLLERYAQRVAEAVRPELDRLDPNAERPLVLFAADPLASLYREQESRRRVVLVSGSPDELRADEIDAQIRRELATLNAAQNNQLVARLADGAGGGLILTDLTDIGRAAAAGSVATLVYDFTVDILGTYDRVSGEIGYADDGYDLLSAVVLNVLDRGGAVVPVRSDEIDNTVWNGQCLAGLRYA